MYNNEKKRMNMTYKFGTLGHQWTARRSVAERLLHSFFGAPLALLWSSFCGVKEIAGSGHTLTCCLSKLRSSLEAGKKQLRVWLQYVCNVAEVLFDRPSNRADYLWCPERLFHDSNKRNRLLYIHAESVKILHFRHHFEA